MELSATSLSFGSIYLPYTSLFLHLTPSHFSVFSAYVSYLFLCCLSQFWHVVTEAALVTSNPQPPPTIPQSRLCHRDGVNHKTPKKKRNTAPNHILKKIQILNFALALAIYVLIIYFTLHLNNKLM